MTPYYQIENPKHEAVALPNTNAWFTRPKHFESLEEARTYARNFKCSRILRIEVIQELSTYACDLCQDGLIYSKVDIGNYDLCENCQGTGKAFFQDSKNRDY